MQNAKCKITDETSGLTVGAAIGRPPDRLNQIDKFLTAI